jgi:hypothetical protein
MGLAQILGDEGRGLHVRRVKLGIDRRKQQCELAVPTCAPLARLGVTGTGRLARAAIALALRPKNLRPP